MRRKPPSRRTRCDLRNGRSSPSFRPPLREAASFRHRCRRRSFTTRAREAGIVASTEERPTRPGAATRMSRVASRARRGGEPRAGAGERRDRRHGAPRTRQEDTTPATVDSGRARRELEVAGGGARRSRRWSPSRAPAPAEPEIRSFCLIAAAPPPAAAPIAAPAVSAIAAPVAVETAPVAAPPTPLPSPVAACRSERSDQIFREEETRAVRPR